MELFLCEIRPGMKEVGRYKVPAGGATYVSLSSLPVPCHAHGRGIKRPRRASISTSRTFRIVALLAGIEPPLAWPQRGPRPRFDRRHRELRRPQHGVAGFDRNGWPTSVGISGRFASEYAVLHTIETHLEAKCSDGSYVLREIASRSRFRGHRLQRVQIGHPELAFGPEFASGTLRAAAAIAGAAHRRVACSGELGLGHRASILSMQSQP
jgi:hypothetical protein